jgi:hypothetical protein
MLTSYQAYTPLSDYLKEENFAVYSDKRVDDLPMLMDQLKEQLKLYDYFFGLAQNFSNFGHVGLLGELSLDDELKEILKKVITLQEMLTNLLVRVNQLRGLPFDKDIPWQWCVHPMFHNAFNDGIAYAKKKPKTPSEGEVINDKARLLFWMFAQNRWKHDASINKKTMIDQAIEDLELHKSAHTLRKWLLQAEKVNAIDVPDQHTQPGRPSKI